MKKIFIIALILFAAFQSFGQTGNDTTKYVYYRYTYGNRLARYWADTVLNIPNDTTYSKFGVARKVSTLYVGNGSWWTAVGSGTGTVTNVATGFGLTGGPITNTGTIKADTSLNGIITWKENKRKLDSLAATITTYTNPMTTLGDIIYGASAGAQTRLPGNTTTTLNALTQTGTGSGSAIPIWKPTLIYTPSASPLPGNHIILDAAGTGATDAVSIATVQDGIVGNGCQVIYSGSGFVFTITSPCNYYIGGNPYTIPTTNVTLAAADGTNPRQDAIVVTTTPSGTSVAGTAQVNPEVPTVDQTTQLFLTSVLVDAGATTPTQVGQEIVRDEGAGGEASITKTSVTSTDNYSTNPYNGSISQRFTAMSNGGFWYYQKASGSWSKSNYSTLIFYIRNNAAFNAARNLVASLWNTATQVGVNVNLTTYGYIKATTGTYMKVAVPMSAFGGADIFNRIRITNTGTGGTVDVQFDYIQLQSGIVIQTGGTPQRYGIEDNVYTSDRANNLAGFSHNFNSVSKFTIKSTATPTDSTLVVYNSGGAPFFRVSANDGTVYMPSALNAGNSTFIVGSGLAILGQNADLTVLPGSRLTSYQHQLELKRRDPWSGLDAGIGTTIINDTTGTLGVSDSTLYKALKVTFTNSTNGWQAEKFTVFGSGMVKMFNGPAFPGTPTGGIYLGANGGELKVIDASGNTTTLSPHNFTGIPYKPKPLGWTYHSENNGNYITVDMLKQAETVERLTSEIEALKKMIYELKGQAYKSKKRTKLIYRGKVK